MNRIYSWLFVIAVLVIGLGFYRGWFTLWSGREAIGNKVNLNLTLDPDKMKQDVETVKTKSINMTP
jgi:hypothetical protein